MVEVRAIQQGHQRPRICQKLVALISVSGADVTRFFEASGGQIVTRVFRMCGDTVGDRFEPHASEGGKFDAPAVAPRWVWDVAVAVSVVCCPRIASAALRSSREHRVGRVVVLRRPDLWMDVQADIGTIKETGDRQRTN